MDGTQRSIALDSDSLVTPQEIALPRVLFIGCDHSFHPGSTSAGTVIGAALASEEWQVACFDPPKTSTTLFKGRLAGDILQRLVDKAAFIRELTRQISRFDIIHLDTCTVRGITRLALPALVLGKFFGKKIVLNFGSAETEQFLDRYGGWFHPLLKAADAVIVGSRYLEKIVGRSKLTPSRLAAPVDPGTIVHRTVTTPQPKILVRTSLEPARNVGRAIRAFRLVKQKYPRTEMVILGSGSRLFALRREVAANQLHGIQFISSTDSAVVARYYNECDVFLHPVIADESPSAIVAAFAAGLPVVATDADGVLHMLRDRVNALVVPVGDHVAMADRIIELVEDPELTRKLSERGRRESERYAWTRVRQDWVNLYKRLTAGQ